MLERALTIRAALPEDESFLRVLYADTRAAELDAWGWSAPQRAQFLEFQFRAQNTHFRTQYPDAEHSIVLADGHPVGHLLVARAADEIYVVDIALLRENTGLGFGSYLIGRLQTECVERGVPLRLQVAVGSRAVRFYERLQFSLVENRETHFLLEWSPRARRLPE